MCPWSCVFEMNSHQMMMLDFLPNEGRTSAGWFHPPAFTQLQRTRHLLRTVPCAVLLETTQQGSFCLFLEHWKAQLPPTIRSEFEGQKGQFSILISSHGISCFRALICQSINKELLVPCCLDKLEGKKMYRSMWSICILSIKLAFMERKKCEVMRSM